MLMFDLSGAEVAEVAGFSGVWGVGCNNICAWIVGSKSSKLHVTTKQHIYACVWLVSSRCSRVSGGTGV